MSNITYSRPASSYDINAWNNLAVSSSSVTQFQLTDGVHTVDAKGIFVSNTSTGLAGNLTAMTWSESGAPVLSVSGININVQQMLAGRISITEKLFDGDDTIIGSYGNDGFATGAGNDNINGGGGVDTVFYAGTKSNVSVVNNGSNFTVKANGKVDTLTNVERVGMGDGSVLALDVKAGENTGSAYRLYQAAFDRKPDAAGLKFWTGALDSGASATQVAQGFVSSKEFQTLNPSTDPTSLVNSYYQHVLHRPADAAGLAFWSDAMNHGTTSAQLLVSFSESQENINNTAADLNNGVWLV